MNGHFVISLDFEKIWGVFDSKPNGDYLENINNVDEVIDRLLTLSGKFGIKLTFATVGFLFNKDKDSFNNNIPTKIPSYKNKLHDPYPIIENLGENENEDRIHYAHKTLLKIKQNGNHEIGTHTYCHYYCLEDGQTIEQFDEDLKMAKKVAKDIDVEIKSIVFPRNQVRPEYLKVCVKHGILSYRGIENHSIYQPRPKKESKNLLQRGLRLSDAYINITGNHSHSINNLKTNGIINLPSSSFFRPYNKKLSFLEFLKVKRVQKGMIHAAKKDELFHMWFHPHNFGKNIDENFRNLELIFNTYSHLKKKYTFESITMSELAIKLSDF
jgi:hypothetical protein